MNINIYTDGAHSSKTNIGGWAFVAVEESAQHPIKQSGWEHNTTNNRMELYAVAKALQFARNVISYETPMPQVTIYTDSAYIANAFKDRWFDNWRNNGWKTSKRTPVLNQDLWEIILAHYELIQSWITITKINGHAGHAWNELADQLAVTARTVGAKEHSTKGENNE